MPNTRSMHFFYLKCLFGGVEKLRFFGSDRDARCVSGGIPARSLQRRACVLYASPRK
jgi:hypothetical protein